VLKEELGLMYIGIPRFFIIIFGRVSELKPIAKVVLEKCENSNKPIYRKGND
jgi:hypothetical protein